MPDLSIIDTHQHLWELELFPEPWTSAQPPLNRTYSMADYLTASAGLNVVKTVYMEVALHRPDWHREAKYVIDLCEREDNPMAGAVIAGDLCSDDFDEYMAPYRGSRWIKGVRSWYRLERGAALPEALLRNARRLGEWGMRLDISSHNGLEPDRRLAEACPDTQFILDHCGSPNVQEPDLDPWRRDLAALAECPNVACKVSGYVGSARPGEWTSEDLRPITEYSLACFGPDRVMFAGDWPVCTRAATLRQWMEALRSLVRDRPVDEQRRLFHDNAARIYGLG